MKASGLRPMVNFKRKHIPVNDDRRMDTRIEFHYPVAILGIDEEAQILEFSVNGFHIEIQAANSLVIGQVIKIALRLPTDSETLRIRAKVVYKDKSGIGCRFVDLGPAHQEKLEHCFNVFNSTLPIE